MSVGRIQYVPDDSRLHDLADQWQHKIVAAQQNEFGLSFANSAELWSHAASDLKIDIQPPFGTCRSDRRHFWVTWSPKRSFRTSMPC